MIKYNKSEEWVSRGDKFTVVIKHWKSGKCNNFNVYANIFNGHKLFRKLKETMHGIPDSMPFHRGATYCDWSRSKTGKILGKKYGSDYNHLYDNFENVERIEDHPYLERDAEELIEYLSK